MTALEFAGTATPLAPGDIEAVAAAMSVEPAVVRAVKEIEAAGSGFLPDGRPKILYEAHLFFRLTGGTFGRSNISSPNWDRSLYGAPGAHQYDRLAGALALDRASALKSASWGGFQILGSNFRACGFADVDSFVAAMMTGERAHLDAFAAFCRTNRLDRHLRTNPPSWAAFARGYNGPGYADNEYDIKLEAAWRAALRGDDDGERDDTSGPEKLSPDDAIDRIQEAIRDAGHYTGDIDHKFGPGSRKGFNALLVAAGQRRMTP